MDVTESPVVDPGPDEILDAAGRIRPMTWIVGDIAMEESNNELRAGRPAKAEREVASYVSRGVADTDDHPAIVAFGINGHLLDTRPELMT
jgi:hypothetical protein